MVKRYVMLDNHTEIAGEEVVLASDYAVLEARCRAAEKILHDAGEELNRHWFSDDGSYNNDEVIDLCERIDAFFRGDEPLKVGSSSQETAVKQICATCDDWHDSGYYNHNFVPKPETIGEPERPFAWYRQSGAHDVFARGDWPPPEPDDTAWQPLYMSPEGRPARNRGTGSK